MPELEGRKVSRVTLDFGMGSGWLLGIWDWRICVLGFDFSAQRVYSFCCMSGGLSDWIRYIGRGGGIWTKRHVGTSLNVRYFIHIPLRGNSPDILSEEVPT